MKKYIRTKNGIYDTTTMEVASIYENGVLVKNVSYTKNIGDFTILHIYTNDIIKQADTIEELCDKFVWISIENEYHIRIANEYSLRASKMQLGCPQLKEIYGAIWTDKGLIYVAKMNDKGDKLGIHIGNRKMKRKLGKI